MKKLLPILFLCFSIVSFAQEDTKVDKRLEGESNYNELKVNALFTILGAFDASYERTLNKNSAIGFSALYVYDQDRINNLEWAVGPYYRYYFGKKYASGFFVEGFGLLNSTRETFLFFVADEFETDFGLGIGFGGKWVSESGFIAELNLGFGRNLFNSDNDELDGIGKAGITIGYRF